MAVIYADITESWPKELKTEVKRITSRLRKKLDIKSDPPCTDLATYDSDYSIRNRFQKVLESHELACYHATRLLPHEIDWIKKGGLEVLSDDLRSRKINAAADHYPNLITKEVAKAIFEREGPSRWQKTASVRSNRLFLATPLSVMLSNGAHELLATWGGEALGWHDGKNEVNTRAINDLTVNSTETIVEVKLKCDFKLISRPIWPIFVGIHLGLHGCGTEWSIQQSIPAREVICLIQPRDRRWPIKLSG